MAEMIEVYIDPSLAASPQIGDGSIGSPYSSIEHAIRNTAWNTDGIRLNVKAGTAAVLEQNLFTTAVTEEAWNPGFNTGVLCIQGYTATAGDGGKAEIDCNTFAFWDDGGTDDGITFIDLRVHNSATADVVNSDDCLTVAFCEFYDCGEVENDFEGYAYQCYFHDTAAGVSFRAQNYGNAEECYFVCDNAASAAAVVLGSTRTSFAYRCIFDVRATFTGAMALAISNNRCSPWSCSFYAAGNAGVAAVNFSGTGITPLIINNVFEGFSGAGSSALEFNSATEPVFMYQANSIYNCATEESNFSKQTIYNVTRYETLASSPFADPANQNFAPNDVGTLKEGAWPTTIGAAYV